MRPYVTTTDAIIIGAGMSGINAAAELHQKGHSVIVLEARDRVGGRTYTVEREIPDVDARDTNTNNNNNNEKKTKKVCFDLGGQWAGPTQHRLKQLSKKLGLEEVKQYTQGNTIIHYRGQVIAYSGIIPHGIGYITMADLLNGLWTTDRLANGVPVDAPWECPRAREYDSMTVQTFMDRQFWTTKAKDLYKLGIQAVFCCEPAEISFLFFLMYVHSAGGMNKLLEVDGGAQESKFKMGTQHIAEKLVETTIGKDRVKLRSPVTKIEQAPSDNDNDSDSDNNWVITHTSSGERYRSRYVIIAMSPSLMARINFVPAMPSMRDQFHQRMPVAHILKTITFFRSAFWRHRSYNGIFSSDRDPVRYCFDSCLEDSPSLIGFIVGDAARAWSEPCKNRQDRIRAILRQYAEIFILSAAAPKLEQELQLEAEPLNENVFLEHLHQEGDTPAMRRALCFLRQEFVYYEELDWGSEEFSRGAPCGMMSPGSVTTCARAIREPVGHIHFAGTETATQWCGYIEGALQAGERAADEVHRRLAQ